VSSACSAPAGYSAIAGDCDDTTKKVNPNAVEVVYDAVDNDCDPATPDDDLDGDGAPLVRDCDDAQPLVADHLPEICDGLDNDCDGLIDDADDSLYTTDEDRSWFDGDGDRYGDPAMVDERCVVLPAWVGNDDDCDDENPSLPANWQLDADGNGSGAGNPVGFGCTPPASDTVLEYGLQDCDDTDFDKSPDALDPCGDGVDDNCDGADAWCHVPPWEEFRLERAEVTLLGVDLNGNLGSAVTGIGDVNLDGFDDLAVGAAGLDSTSSTAPSGCSMAPCTASSPRRTTRAPGSRALRWEIGSARRWPCSATVSETAESTC
jgi:hypothetical protein